MIRIFTNGICILLCLRSGIGNYKKPLDRINKIKNKFKMNPVLSLISCLIKSFVFLINNEAIISNKVFISKGQIMLPKEIRESLDINEGDTLTI